MRLQGRAGQGEHIAVMGAVCFAHWTSFPAAIKQAVYLPPSDKLEVRCSYHPAHVIQGSHVRPLALTAVHESDVGPGRRRGHHIGEHPRLNVAQRRCRVKLALGRLLCSIGQHDGVALRDGRENKFSGMGAAGWRNQGWLRERG